MHIITCAITDLLEAHGYLSFVQPVLVTGLRGAECNLPSLDPSKSAGHKAGI